MQNQPPSVQALQAFEAAARLLSFQAAAMELNVTASAISHRIRNLETYCGKALFVRTARQVNLTPYGRDILEQVNSILVRISKLPDKRRSLDRLKVGAPSLFFNELLLPRLSDFQKRYPDYYLDLHVSDSLHQLVRCEAAVRYGKPSDSGLCAQRLMATHHIVVKAPGLASASASLREVMMSCPRIDLSYAPRAWAFIHRDISDDGHIKTDTLTVRTMSEAVVAAKAGLGVALVIEELVQRDLAEGRLIQMPGFRRKKQDFYLVYRPTDDGHPVMRAFCSWISEQC